MSTERRLYDPFVYTIFPCGTVFVVRLEYSGVVFDQNAKPIDDELSTAMLLIKARKLERSEIAGRA